MKNPNIVNSNPVMNKVQINLDMLRLLLLNWVGWEVHDVDIVAVDERAVSLAKSCRSHHISATPLATTRYSALALERKTTVCRLDDQEIRLPPRNTA
jgi:hypothetical protein